MFYVVDGNACAPADKGNKVILQPNRLVLFNSEMSSFPTFPLTPRRNANAEVC